MPIQSINPANGEIIQTYQEFSFEEIEHILTQVQTAFSSWRETSFADRAKPMKRTAVLLRERKEDYARLMALEMGKPVNQGFAEIDKCAWVCDYYADHAEEFLSPQEIPTDAKRSFVSFQPLGIILAIMPWNFPFWQVFRFAVPSMMAGNAAVLKHASNVPGCALAIEKIFLDAGFPENLFRTLLISGSKVGAVIEHSLIKAVTLTGSTPAGREVAKKAGMFLKKTVLELGGSDPYVILADADLEKTVSTCVTARLINTGQSCIAAKRFIVPYSIQESFETLVVEQMKSKKMGDPLTPGIDLGPLARLDLRDQLHRQVQRSIKTGARLLLGGKKPKGLGTYYPATVLTNVKLGMPAYNEELFGPVAAIIPVVDEAEAIRVANDTPFGLGAAVFTRDVNKGIELAEKRINAGCCFVNDFVRSDPRLPFGGIKESGYGRELSVFGIHEFVNIKTIYVAK